MPEPTHIGRFEVLATLGEGGMGAVYRARDPRLDRIVAIKLMKHISEEHVDRFRLEARTAARLIHPNITLVLEFDEDSGGNPYLVMECLDGNSVKDLLGFDEAVAPAVAVDIIRQVCLGLHHAHAHHIAAHRDVKPANIQVTASGVVKVMDFGIAKLADEIQLTHNLTRANTILGTLFYMSPEQVRGDKLDGRSDVWSAAVVLYELLYRSRPFDAPEDDEVMKKIVLEDLGELAPIDVHGGEDLQRILVKALEKRRERRFASAGEMAEALAAWLLKLQAAPPGPVVPREPSSEDLFAEGRELYAAQEYTRAAACFRAVLELIPGKRSARFNLERCEAMATRKHLEELYKLGTLCFKNREHALAISAFEELLRIEPGNEDARAMINWARVERTRIEDQKGGDLEDLIKDTLSQIASDPGIRVSPDPTQEHLAADSPGDALHPDPDGEPTRSVDHPSPPPTVPTPPRPRPPTAPGSGNTGTAPRPAAADGDPGGKRRGLSDQRTASRPHAEVETPVGVGARDRTSSKVKGWLKRLIGG